MRQFNKFKDTKGFITIWQRVLRFRYMITEQAKERCRILAFWEKYGNLATKEAFKVSRATLFRWQQALKKTDGKLEGLNKKSTAPKNKRKRIIPQVVQDFILAERKFDPHLSKDKLSVLMREDKVAVLSSSTVGRMLDDLKKQKILPNPKHISYHGNQRSVQGVPSHALPVAAGTKENRWQVRRSQQKEHSSQEQKKTCNSETSSRFHSDGKKIRSSSIQGQALGFNEGRQGSIFVFFNSG